MDAEIGTWTRRGIGFGLGVLIVAAVVVGLFVTAKLVALVLISILLASALAPLVDRLRSNGPFGRATSAGLLFLAAGAIVVALGVLLVTTALSQIDEIGDRVHDDQVGPRDGRQPPACADRGRVGALLDALDRAVRRSPAPTADQVIVAGFTIVEAFGALVTVVTLVYFWLLERARIQRFVLAFVALPRRGASERPGTTSRMASAGGSAASSSSWP